MPALSKALDKLQNKPTDFKWPQVERIMLHFGYKLLQGDGSRVKFYNKEKNSLLLLHKPHNPKTLRPYQVDLIINKLKEDGYI
ncbi:MAG: type II toxin-antitoxin system HicA family toxin [Desulfobulbaceae bacterium]|nr:type II toxin-antitoxin system HicA family toxin [Desulfobulbaceae bacterium]